MTPVPPPPFDLDAALGRLRGRKTALVLMHDNPDPDSMAAAECLRTLLSTRGGLDVTVARGGIIGRPENRAMVQLLGLQHVPVERVDFGQFGVIALVDTQPETGNNSLPRDHRVDIVVDHHPRRPGADRAAWCDVREDFGASCTIAYGYLRAAGLTVGEDLATALLYGIKSETRDLGREASDHEYEAYTELIGLAELEKLHAIAEPKVPAAHFAALDRAIRAAEVRGSFVAVNVGALDYPDLVAEIADLLLPFERAHWVLCVGQHEGTVFLSVRTDVKYARAGDLIRKIVAGRGAAGGHGMVAGGRMVERVRSPEELAAVYDRLVAAMAAALGVSGERPVPLVP